MLEGLDAVRWAKLKHAYGSAADVPDLLRNLLDPDAKVRSNARQTLYGNVFHQGTRFPAAPYVVPFLIELCASPEVPGRGEVLRYWGSLITGFFSVRERPTWGDGKRIYWDGKVHEGKSNDSYSTALHRVYRESLKGHDLLCGLLADPEPAVRVGAAWVLACLPTVAAASVPKLEARLRDEPSGWARAAIAFALGELGAPGTLRDVLSNDPFPAARCMAACQLARIEPTETLVGPLLKFLSEPVEGYEGLPGAGGKSTGDAAYAISNLPPDVQLQAIPAVCDRLDQARAFDTAPLVRTLLSAAFPPRDTPVTELTDLQRQVLARMVNTGELWSIGNLFPDFKAHGLPADRKQCAGLAGVAVTEDEALKRLRSGLAFANIGFLQKGREGILEALELDPAVMERAPTPEECWLLYAKAFAETDADRAVAAYQRAVSINPWMARRVDPACRLADLLKERGIA